MLHWKWRSTQKHSIVFSNGLWLQSQFTEPNLWWAGVGLLFLQFLLNECRDPRGLMIMWEWMKWGLCSLWWCGLKAVHPDCFKRKPRTYLILWPSCGEWRNPWIIHRTHEHLRKHSGNSLLPLEVTISVKLQVWSYMVLKVIFLSGNQWP